MEHVLGGYAGDLEAACIAHRQVCAHHAAQDASAHEMSGACSEPDCGPYGATWYAGDVEAARAAHTAHSHG